MQLCLILMERGTGDHAVLLSLILVEKSTGDHAVMFSFATFLARTLSRPRFPSQHIALSLFSHYVSVSTVPTLMTAHAAAVAHAPIYTSVPECLPCLGFCLDAVDLGKTQSLPLESSRLSHRGVTPFLPVLPFFQYPLPDHS